MVDSVNDHNKMLIDRIRGMPAQPGGLSEEIGWLLEEIEELKAKIDRLRAEVEVCKACIDQHFATILAKTTPDRE